MFNFCALPVVKLTLEWVGNTSIASIFYITPHNSWISSMFPVNIVFFRLMLFLYLYPCYRNVLKIIDGISHISLILLLYK